MSATLLRSRAPATSYGLQATRGYASRSSSPPLKNPFSRAPGNSASKPSKGPKKLPHSALLNELNKLNVNEDISPPPKSGPTIGRLSDLLKHPERFPDLNIPMPKLDLNNPEDKRNIERLSELAPEVDVYQFFGLPTPPKGSTKKASDHELAKLPEFNPDSWSVVQDKNGTYTYNVPPEDSKQVREALDMLYKETGKRLILTREELEEAWAKRGRSPPTDKRPLGYKIRCARRQWRRM